jgi:hypothetical protein
VTAGEWQASREVGGYVNVVRYPVALVDHSTVLLPRMPCCASRPASANGMTLEYASDLF